MSKIKGTNIPAPIVPYATNDNYPTHYAKYGKGGYLSVATLQDRNAIPKERIEEGMLVFVLEDKQSYQYIGEEWVAARVGKEDSLKFEGSTNYNARVENGYVVAYNELPTYRQIQPKSQVELSCIKLNSFYLGEGKNNNKHNFLPCSHRFIELANIGDKQVSLNGLFLKIYFRGAWQTVALNGVINPGNTYLIRGEQVSVIDADTTYIKVNQFNQDWDSKIIDAGNGIMIYLCWGNESGQVLDRKGEFIDMPREKEDIFNSLSYIDCVSTNKTTSITGTGIAKTNSIDSSKIIYARKCPLDPCYTDTRDNTVDWRYHIINDDRYRPGASYEGKDITWGNDWLKDKGPITLTCTVGRNAEISNNNPIATRCFTWTTKDSECRYLFVKGVNETEWSVFAGNYGKDIKDAQQRMHNESTLNSDSFEFVDIFTNKRTGNTIPEGLFNYYNRAVWETYTGEVAYTYRFILGIQKAGKYMYACGRLEDLEDTSKLDVKYFHIMKESSGRYLKYLQVGNYNIETYESAVLLKNSSHQILRTYPFNQTSSLIPTIDFIVNTGNIVKHGTRPQEWVYYINNNVLSRYYAEFITPGENDLGEVALYDLGVHKVNYQMFNLFYTFEQSTENLPIYSNTGYALMPGLYSTNYLGNIIISFNSSVTTNTNTALGEVTTTFDVMGIVDYKSDLPYNDELGIATQYYRKQLEWLFREIYYYWNKERYYSDIPEDFSENINIRALKRPRFTSAVIPGEKVYISDYVTILTNRAPIEPYTDLLYRERSEKGKEVRTEDYNTTDNLNKHLSFLASRFFKLWQIKAVLSENNWGISGVTKRIHDASLEYAPESMNTGFRDVLIDSKLKQYDTFQPVIVVENQEDASRLASSQEARYIWNGSSYTLYISYTSGGYTSIEPMAMERSGLYWNGRYSIFLAGRDSANYRDNVIAPRYIYVNSTLNQFTLYDIKRNRTLDWTLAENMKQWFEGYTGDNRTYPYTSKMIPTFIVHTFIPRTYATESHEGARNLEFVGITLKKGSTILNLNNWNMEEQLKPDIGIDPLRSILTSGTANILLTRSI